MKKILTVFLAFIMVISVFSSVMVVGAAPSDFSVNISAPAQVAFGEEIELSISVSGISVSGGIVRLDMGLVYNSDEVEYVSASSVAAPSADWNFSASSSDSGVQIVAEDSTKASPATTDASIKYRVVFKVKSELSVTSTSFAFSGLSARDADGSDHTGTSTGCTVNLTLPKKQLKAPENLIWTDMSASWSDVENASGYKLYLYYNGGLVGSAYETASSYYDFSDIIKESGSYTFKVVAVGEGEYADSVQASSTAFDFVKDPEKLSAPVAGSFNNGIASWNSVANAGSYVVELYKDGSVIGSPVTTSNLTYDFSDIINTDGTYTFKVKAVPASSASKYAESDYSASSAAYIFSSAASDKLDKPSVSIIENKKTGGITYTITDTNDEAKVKNYMLYFYNDSDGTLAYSISVYSKSGDIACDGVNLISGKSYKASVMVVSADKSKYANSDMSDNSGAAYAQDAITSISVLKQPKVKYNAGDKLDLSKLEIRLVYGSGKTVDIGYNDFNKYGVKLSYTNGAILSSDDDGKRITVRCNGNTVSTSKLSVEGNDDCDHQNTTEERKEPTCTEEGYVRIVCTGCGKEISKETLSAKGHLYGDWTVEKEATTLEEGLRKHICTACGYEESEVIAKLAPETSSDDVTTDAADDTSDSSDKKTMNTVLICIMCFLIAAIIADVAAIIIVKKRKGAEENPEYDGSDDYDEGSSEYNEYDDTYDYSDDDYQDDAYDEENEYSSEYEQDDRYSDDSDLNAADLSGGAAHDAYNDSFDDGASTQNAGEYIDEYIIDDTDED